MGKIRLLLRLARYPSNLSRWLTPIDYIRYREFGFVLKAIDHFKPSVTSLLDIGSPKLLPLSLAHYFSKARVFSIDVLESEIHFIESAAARLNIRNLISEVQDAKALDYSDNQFDLVTSVSVFEHIFPERNGDIVAARELGRIMASNGIAIITIPFARLNFAEYRVGEVYERMSSDGAPIFFQRFYDYDLVMKNIVQASGLEILSMAFVEERFFSKDIHTRLAHYINSSPTQNLVFGPWFPLLSQIFLSPPRPLEACKKPYICGLVLRKP
jgi:ubiquinone/menaquinone biosynthesis C-methylase UbiE